MHLEILAFFSKYLEKCFKYHGKYLRLKQKVLVISNARVNTVSCQYWHTLIQVGNR